MSDDRLQAERDAEYIHERESAEDDGTALPERTHDFSPPDLFHAAHELAHILQAQEGGRDAAREMNLALGEPALWGMLDVERAAFLVRERFPVAWPFLIGKFPWLDTAAESGGDGEAVGAMASQF